MSVRIIVFETPLKSIKKLQTHDRNLVPPTKYSTFKFIQKHFQSTNLSIDKY